MKDKDLANYSLDSIKFLFDESCKLIDETFKSYRESMNKCYAAFAVYSSILSYCAVHVVEHGVSGVNGSYLIMLLGVVVSIYSIWSSLMPKNIKFPGTQPSMIVSEFFNTEEMRKDHEQYRQLLITKILTIDEEIPQNIHSVKKIIGSFKDSVKIVLSTIVLSLAFAFVTKCFI